MIVYALYGVAAVVLAVIAVALGASSHGFIYGGSLAVTLILCAIALVSMIGPPSSCRSSCGGWRAGIDALAAFFLVVVNFGDAAASLFQISLATLKRV